MHRFMMFGLLMAMTLGVGTFTVGCDDDIDNNGGVTQEVHRDVDVDRQLDGDREVTTTDTIITRDRNGNVIDTETRETETELKD